MVDVTAISAVMRGAMLPHMAEMLGARAERRLAVITVAVTPVQVLVALTAGFTESFARPVGATVDYTGRLAAFEAYRPNIYEETDEDP